MRCRWMHGARRWPTESAEVRRLCVPPVRPRPPPIGRCAGGLPAGRLIDPPRAPHAANRRSRARPPPEDAWAGGVLAHDGASWPARPADRRGGRAPLRASWPHGRGSASSPPPSTPRGSIWCACAAPASPVGGGARFRAAAARQRRLQVASRAGRRAHAAGAAAPVCKTRCELAARTSRATSPVVPLACRRPASGRRDCIPIFLASAQGARVECGATGRRPAQVRRALHQIQYLPNISWIRSHSTMYCELVFWAIAGHSTVSGE